MIGGTINQNGAFIMRAEKVGSDTLLAQIVRMVGEAQERVLRSSDSPTGSRPFRARGDRGGAIAFAVWLVGPQPRLAYALVAAVCVLIIACPCALGLATPMSIMVGNGRGAQAGVLIRNAEALERLERVDTLVIDKTGTLTEGKPTVTPVVPADGVSEPTSCKLAAIVERASEHPLAAAIVRFLHKERGVEPLPVRGFDSPAGKGAIGMVEGKRVVLGNAAFLAELSIGTAVLEGDADRLRHDGATAIFIAINGKAAGVIAISDPIKTTTPAALSER